MIVPIEKLIVRGLNLPLLSFSPKSVMREDARAERAHRTGGPFEKPLFAFSLSAVLLRLR